MTPAYHRPVSIVAVLYNYVHTTGSLSIFFVLLFVGYVVVRVLSKSMSALLENNAVCSKMPVWFM